MTRQGWKTWMNNWIRNATRGFGGPARRLRRPGWNPRVIPLEARSLMSATTGLMPGVTQAGATVTERYQVSGEAFSLAQQSQQWAVSVQSGTVEEYLRANPGMANWVVDRTLDTQTAILRSTGPVGQSADFTRASQNVAWSSPVYQTAAGRWMVPTNEVVVSLRANQRAADFFARDTRFTGYRPLPGSADQFIATVAGGAGSASLRVANDLAADARVQWVTPNFWQEFQRYATTNDPEFSRQWRRRRHRPVPRR
ncbi:MAG: hypothetical protein ACKOJF_28410, partial [Planctomycetaceae bacterium]